jgi:hypothetical protein
MEREKISSSTSGSAGKKRKRDEDEKEKEIKRRLKVVAPESAIEIYWPQQNTYYHPKYNLLPSFININEKIYTKQEYFLVILFQLI